jgi:hypothetical protein
MVMNALELPVPIITSFYQVEDVRQLPVVTEKFWLWPMEVSTTPVQDAQTTMLLSTTDV